MAERGAHPRCAPARRRAFTGPMSMSGYVAASSSRADQTALSRLGLPVWKLAAEISPGMAGLRHPCGWWCG